MNVWHRGGCALSVLALSATIAQAQDRIEISEGALTLSAPSSIDCSEPPEFKLEGPATALFAEDRSPVNRMVSQMAKGLAQSCPDVEELAVSGEDRGVQYSFTVQRDNGWLLDPTVEDKPEESTKETVAQTASEVEQPKTAGSAEPEIKPGLAIEQFAGVFGPVKSVRGYLPLNNDDIWSRVLAARAYAEHPEFLQNDELAVEIAERMLTPVEYQQFQGPLAGKQAHQWSVFERRDLANRVRTQLAQGLDTRRQTGPINVYHVAAIQLGEYDFNTGSFPLNGEQLRGYNAPRWRNMQVSNAFDGIVLPNELVASVEQARQLDNYLRQRNDNRLYLAVFARITPNVPPSLEHYASNRHHVRDTELEQIALFADPGLSQILFDYTPALADRQTMADQVAEFLLRPVSFGEDFVRAIGTLSDSDAVAEYLAQTYVNSGVQPKKTAAQVLTEFGETRGPTMMTFSGALQVGTYDPVRKVLPVQSFSVQNQNYQSLPIGFGMRNTFFPQVSEIPMTEEQARRLSETVQNNYQVEFRLDAEMVSGNFQNSQSTTLYLETTHRPHRLVLFSGRQGEIPAKREVLLDVELPESGSGVPSLLESLRIDQ